MRSGRRRAARTGNELVARDSGEEASVTAGERPKVTGVVTSFNEEHNIADCIESLQWCDEIILVDSYSTDRTPEIAESYDKVRFFQRTYYGAGAQKNWALQHVQGDWIFLLDADERCTTGLRDEVLELLQRARRADPVLRVAARSCGAAVPSGHGVLREPAGALAAPNHRACTDPTPQPRAPHGRPQLR
jgi:hypothetical protein